MAASKPESWSELSRQLGVPKKTLGEWREREDAPKTPDIAAWTAYKEQHDLGRGQGKTFEELRKQKLTKEVALLDQKLAREERRVIPAEDVKAFDVAYAAKLDAFLKVKLVLEAPNRVNGKTIAETRVEMDRILDEVRTFQRNGVMKWEPDAA